MALAAFGACASPPRAVAPVTPSAPSITAEQLEGIVQRLAIETSRIRGLAFIHGVPSRIARTADVRAHFRDELATQRDELTIETQIGVALGLLPNESLDRGDDGRADLLGDEAQGYYEPDEATLVLVESEARELMQAGPSGLDARATVVHELVHALQHQHFPARFDDTPSAPALSDRARAELALLEGDATLVTLEWTARHRGGRLLDTPDLAPTLARWTERAQILSEADVPRYIADSLEQPYEDGVVAVGGLYARGGWSRVNAALADDTLTGADLLHPERGAHTETNVPAPAAPAANLTLVTSRTMGELELRTVLTQVMRADRAAALASAWRGDALALFTSHDGSLAVRWDIACAGADEATQLVAALAPLLERWRREGCPRVLGGSAHGCAVADIEAAGATVHVRRGKEPTPAR